MFEFLLYSSLTCPDADAVVFRIKAHESLDTEWKIELIETIKDYTPECPWDANDSRNGKKRILGNQRRLIFTQLQE